eukprot:scaffold2657_cov17-Prasinocladus_malaysianus.AAC.1
MDARARNEAFQVRHALTLQVATVAAEGGYTVAEPIAKLPSMPSRNGSLKLDGSPNKLGPGLSPTCVRQEQASGLC